MLGTEDGIQPALQGSRSQGGYIDPLPAALWTADDQGLRQLAAHRDHHAVLLRGLQKVPGDPGRRGVIQIKNANNIADMDGYAAAQMEKHDNTSAASYICIIMQKIRIERFRSVYGRPCH